MWWQVLFSLHWGQLSSQVSRRNIQVFVGRSFACVHQSSENARIAEGKLRWNSQIVVVSQQFQRQEDISMGICRWINPKYFQWNEQLEAWKTAPKTRRPMPYRRKWWQMGKHSLLQPTSVSLSDNQSWNKRRYVAWSNKRELAFLTDVGFR